MLSMGIPPFFHHIHQLSLLACQRRRAGCQRTQDGEMFCKLMFLKCRDFSASTHSGKNEPVVKARALHRGAPPHLPDRPAKVSAGSALPPKRHLFCSTAQPAFSPQLDAAGEQCKDRHIRTDKQPFSEQPSMGRCGNPHPPPHRKQRR